jgi:hypothetical protein
MRETHPSIAGAMQHNAVRGGKRAGWARFPSQLAAGGLLLALSCPAAAREWFVSTAGSDDAGNGSESKPYRTVQYAVDRATAGDTITVRGPSSNRTYNECDVRLRQKLVLRSYPGERAHIHCDMNTPDSVTVQIDPGASGSRLSGLEISGGMYYGVMLQTGWWQDATGNEKGPTGVVLEDLLIHDTGRDGIKITPKSDNAVIRRVEIHHTGAIYPPGTSLDDKNADGIDNVNGSGMVVEDSYIHHTATTGVYFKGGAADVVIQRNRIEEAGQAGILVGFDTSVEFFDLRANPNYYEAIRGTVRNNYVKGTAYAGIGLYAAKDAVVANNTIVDAAREGHAALYFGIPLQDWDPEAGRPPSVNPKLFNNLVHGSAGRCLDVRHLDIPDDPALRNLQGLRGSTGSDYNAYADDCRFYDGRPGSALTNATLEQWRSATGADIHSLSGSFPVDAKGQPAAGSPVIHAGNPEIPVHDDISGEARDGRPSIGAWQRAAGALSVATAATGGMAAAPPAQAAETLAQAAPVWPWMLLLAIPLALLLGALYLMHKRNVTGWLLAYLRQDWRAPVPAGTTRHLLFCFVDHYEPGWGKPGYLQECARVARWRRDLPRLCARHRDADGRSPVHSFFFPGEEYRPEHLDSLVELCRMGLGEIEIHLHHDDDTEAGLRQKLSRFTRLLADRHDALPRDPVTGQPRWSFIHGNWALDNSHPSGRHCGVDNELIVLREEGCYADFTYPAAPDPCQTRIINRIYRAKDDPLRPKSHDRGERVRVGGGTEGDLVLIQGPLGLRWDSRKFGILPRIENADIRASSPPTPTRIDAWVETGIHVQGRPEWTVVKVHTHGAEDEDMETLLGSAMDQAYDYLERHYNDGHQWKLHYVSARETYNIVRAAEDGLSGDPGQYRDYEIPRPAYQPRASASAAATEVESAGVEAAAIEAEIEGATAAP